MVRFALFCYLLPVMKPKLVSRYDIQVISHVPEWPCYCDVPASNARVVKATRRLVTARTRIQHLLVPSAFVRLGFRDDGGFIVEVSFSTKGENNLLPHVLFWSLRVLSENIRNGRVPNRSSSGDKVPTLPCPAALFTPPGAMCFVHPSIPLSPQVICAVSLPPAVTL